MPRLIADDVTTEAATSLLAEQGGRIAVLSAEGGIFSTLAGRYSGGVPSLEVFLKGHSGDMLRVDRKGRPPEYIPRPALTLGLCVQPEVLRTIASMPGFRSRGLLARILYSLPPNLVGHRQIGTPPVPEDVRDVYGSSVRSLVLTMAEWTDPAVLQLTPGAAELILDAERRLEPRLDPETGDLPASSTGQASRSARPSASRPSFTCPPLQTAGDSPIDERPCRPRSPSWTTTAPTRWPLSTTWASTRPSTTPAPFTAG